MCELLTAWFVFNSYFTCLLFLSVAVKGSGLSGSGFCRTGCSGSKLFVDSLTVSFEFRCVPAGVSSSFIRVASICDPLTLVMM